MSNNKPIQRRRVKWVNDFISLHRLLGTDYTYFYDYKSREYTVVLVREGCTIIGCTLNVAKQTVKQWRQYEREI